MERARFFAELHYLRRLKGGGIDKIDRIKKFYAFQYGFTLGWASKY